MYGRERLGDGQPMTAEEAYYKARETQPWLGLPPDQAPMAAPEFWSPPPGTTWADWPRMAARVGRSIQAVGSDNVINQLMSDVVNRGATVNAAWAPIVAAAIKSNAGDAIPATVEQIQQTITDDPVKAREAGVITGESSIVVAPEIVRHEDDQQSVALTPMASSSMALVNASANAATQQKSMTPIYVAAIALLLIMLPKKRR